MLDQHFKFQGASTKVLGSVVLSGNYPDLQQLLKYLPETTKLCNPISTDFVTNTNYFWISWQIILDNKHY